MYYFPFSKLAGPRLEAKSNSALTDANLALPYDELLP